MKINFKKTFSLIVSSLMLLTIFSYTHLKKEIKPAFTAYTITLQSAVMIGANQQWTWTVTNPNPGNGNNNTLQDVSHWSLPLSPLAEASLISAEYSTDGSTWNSLSIVIERDPSIRVCTTADVLKFANGTSGSAPAYYRATFDRDFFINPYAVSYIKTGGGLQGCNAYYYSGLGTYTD